MARRESHFQGEERQVEIGHLTELNLTELNLTELNLTERNLAGVTGHRRPNRGCRVEFSIAGVLCAEPSYKLKDCFCHDQGLRYVA